MDDTKGTETYNAKEVFIRESGAGMSRNIPPELYAKAQAQVLSAYNGLPAVKAMNLSGFSGRVAKWAQVSRDQRLQMAASFTDVDEIKAAIAAHMDVEEEQDVLEYLVQRKGELETAEAAKG